MASNCGPSGESNGAVSILVRLHTYMITLHPTFLIIERTGLSELHVSAVLNLKNLSRNYNLDKESQKKMNHVLLFKVF